MSKGLLTDMLKYLPAQIVPGLIGLVSMPIVTRLFLPAEYGHYSLATATVMVLSTLFGWLPTSVIRFYPTYARQDRLGIFHTTLMKLAALALVGPTVLYYVVLLVLRSRMPDRLWFLLLLGGFLFPATCLFNLLQYVLRSQRLAGRYSAFGVWQSGAAFGLALVLIFGFRLGIDSLLVGAILSILLVLPLQYRHATAAWTKGPPGRIDWQGGKAMFVYGMPLVVGNLAAWVLALSDRYLLGLLRGSVEVGIYSLSYNIADRSLMLLIGLFVMASTPIGMHVWEERGAPGTMQFVTGVTRLYLLACVPATVGLSVLSRLVVGILGGAAYAGGYRIMPYVLFGVLLLGLQQLYQFGLLFHRRTGFITLATVSAGLANVLLNLLLIPKYGYLAAGVVTLFSYVLLLLLMVEFSRRFFVWSFPWRSLFHVAVASAVMGGVVHYLDDRLGFPSLPRLLLCTAVGLVVYVIALLALREFSSQELRVLRLAVPGLHLGRRNAPEAGDRR
jgi:O-antigen/teichoic acid export membrane protein